MSNKLTDAAFNFVRTLARLRTIDGLAVRGSYGGNTDAIFVDSSAGELSQALREKYND